MSTLTDAIARLLPLDFERHESQTIKDAARRDRDELAHRIAQAVENIFAARQANEHDECAALMEAAADRIEAVGVLHAPVRMHPELRFRPWCAECSQGFTAGGDAPPSERRVYWPCPTALAVGMSDPLDVEATP